MDTNFSESSSDVKPKLDALASLLDELKVRYDQYFTGILPLPPDKMHTEAKLSIRRLRRAPFKNSSLSFKLTALEHRYNTLNTYWQRVLKEREEGTYKKDIFKANMREKSQVEAEYAQTDAGKVTQRMAGIFNSYRDALEKNTGKKHQLDYDKFEQMLISRAKTLQQEQGATKIGYRVVVKNGKDSVQAFGKD